MFPICYYQTFNTQKIIKNSDNIVNKFYSYRLLRKNFREREKTRTNVFCI